VRDRRFLYRLILEPLRDGDALWRLCDFAVFPFDFDFDADRLREFVLRVLLLFVFVLRCARGVTGRDAPTVEALLIGSTIDTFGFGF